MRDLKELGVFKVGLGAWIRDDQRGKDITPMTAFSTSKTHRSVVAPLRTQPYQ